MKQSYHGDKAVI